MDKKEWLKKQVKSGADKTLRRAKKLYQTFDEKDRNLKSSTGKGIFHTYTEKGGDLAGKVIGTPVSYIGKKVKSPFVDEIGKNLHGATKFSGNIAGQVGQGTWKTTQGFVSRNKADLYEGLGEFATAAGKTMGAVYKTSAYTLQNSAAVINGVYHKDYHKALTGIKGVGKVVIVGAVAITVFDLIEGDDVSAAENGDFLLTHNSHLDGQLHPETGVPYEAQTVVLENENEVIGVFPVFDAVAEVELPAKMYESSDYRHFSYANSELVDAVSKDPGMASQFTVEQLEQIYESETPDGYTWHHHEQLGKLQLVDEELHAKSGHSGGRSIWGGGSNAR
ncbi:hypothetical protein BKP45_08050 [Anaerobacillus alkalidiazotrophicus]|uniref:HNH endonuclease n=1 Tax=Anaerobacillus alkalidiazotrophicus TaxID=472963 RepID=A0A1S2M7H3_9BACI|nr:HNH endonuclease [Anaerobacillus alkalidiazotrophicus]OIJ20742.1 hypothetical protein BKP45_08050 [Anaerobacillus alkalidiazotrophicus]